VWHETIRAIRSTDLGHLSFTNLTWLGIGRESNNTKMSLLVWHNIFVLDFRFCFFVFLDWWSVRIVTRNVHTKKKKWTEGWTWPCNSTSGKLSALSMVREWSGEATDREQQRCKVPTKKKKIVFLKTKMEPVFRFVFVFSLALFLVYISRRAWMLSPNVTAPSGWKREILPAPSSTPSIDSPTQICRNRLRPLCILYTHVHIPKFIPYIFPSPVI
jgi:hypothetical protein